MTRSDDSQALIAAAAEWRLIGLLLERPRRGWHAEVARLGREMANPELRRLVTAARRATEGDYLGRLGPGGVVSPREVTYQPFADPGHLLADLAACYDAFAFRPHVEEPIDHLAVEVAFVGYLLLKEAFAGARGDHCAATTTARARRAFIDAHLAAFAAGFTHRLEVLGASNLLATARCLSARLPARPAPEPRRSDENAMDVCGACGGPEAW
ncbi:MAG TPA: molecular chaperone TorD family protein [Candidatus Margulisiibacteriota bacterium]|nr:molecular chaperone TorD family protein [Candidatus Margulisiibacteriota bacterium]